MTVGDPIPLTTDDLQLLGVECATKAPPLAKLRARHHSLARALASGIPPGEAALMTGYTNTHVSVLQADASFRELLTLYEGTTQERYYEMHDRLAALGSDTADELIQRLEDSPQEFTVPQLTDLLTKTADRTGYGPTATVVDVRVGLADKLNAAQNRIDKFRKQEMLDITPTQEGKSHDREN